MKDWCSIPILSDAAPVCLLPPVTLSLHSWTRPQDTETPPLGVTTPWPGVGTPPCSDCKPWPQAWRCKFHVTLTCEPFQCELEATTRWRQQNHIIGRKQTWDSDAIKVENDVHKNYKQSWWWKAALVESTSNGKQDLTMVIQRSTYLVAMGQIPHTPEASFTTLRDVVKQLVLVGKRCRLGGVTLKHTWISLRG